MEKGEKTGRSSGRAKHCQGANNKGFSLTELVVAMSVSLIALGIIACLVTVLNSRVSKSRELSESISQVYAIEDAVTRCFYRWDEAELTMSVTRDSIVFEGSDGEHAISYRDACLVIDGEELRLSRVTDVSFAYDEESDMVKVTVIYEAYDGHILEYRFVLNHHT